MALALPKPVSSSVEVAFAALTDRLRNDVMLLWDAFGMDVVGCDG